MASYEVLTIQGTPGTSRFNRELNDFIEDGWEIFASHVASGGNFLVALITMVVVLRREKK